MRQGNYAPDEMHRCKCGKLLEWSFQKRCLDCGNKQHHKENQKRSEAVRREKNREGWPHYLIAHLSERF